MAAGPPAATTPSRPSACAPRRSAGRSPPLSNPKRSRRILLAATALGLIVLAFLGSRLRVSYRTPLTGCARDNGTGGASALSRWADRLGIPVQALEVPIWEAARNLPGATGHCVLTMGDGSWTPVSKEVPVVDWQNARDWIYRGNTLIVVTTDPGSLPEAVRQDLIGPKLADVEARAVSPFGRLSVDSRPETDRAPVAGDGALTVDANGPRWTVPPTPANGTAGPGAAPAPATGAPTDSVPPDSDPSRWQLAADPRGGVLFRIPVGDGAVYFLLDDFAWTNTGLDQGDNARVLAEILNREIRGGVLAIDEYRHGHGRTESFLAYLLNLPGASASMWLAAAWSLLYLYGRNVRLKPAEAYIEPERRTAQEYIDAVAQLYERARAAPLVVEAVARRLRQVARSSAENPRSVEALLRRAEDYIRREERPASPAAAIRLVNALIQLRKTLYGTRTVS